MSEICRDLLHAWAPYNAVRRPGGFIRMLRCSRCDTVKEQLLDKDGYIIGSSFRYPGGYLREPGSGRLTRADRAELRVQNMGKKVRR